MKDLKIRAALNMYDIVFILIAIFVWCCVFATNHTRQAIGKSGIVTIITEDGNIWELDSADCRITFDTNKTEDITDDIITKIETEKISNTDNSTHSREQKKGKYNENYQRKQEN